VATVGDGPALHKSQPLGLSPQRFGENGNQPGYGPRLSQMKRNDFDQEHRSSQFASNMRGKMPEAHIEKLHEASKHKDQR
jgi:hypothetical protein